MSSTLETELQLLTDWSSSHKKNDEDYKGALLLDRSANCDVTSHQYLFLKLSDRDLMSHSLLVGSLPLDSWLP